MLFPIHQLTLKNQRRWSTLWRCWRSQPTCQWVWTVWHSFGISFTNFHTWTKSHSHGLWLVPLAVRIVRLWAAPTRYKWDPQLGEGPRSFYKQLTAEDPAGMDGASPLFLLFLPLLADASVILRWPALLSESPTSPLPGKPFHGDPRASRSQLRKASVAASGPLVSAHGRFGVAFWDVTFPGSAQMFGRFCTTRQTCVSNVMKIQKGKFLTHSSFPKEWRGEKPSFCVAFRNASYFTQLYWHMDHVVDMFKGDYEHEPLTNRSFFFAYLTWTNFPKQVYMSLRVFPINC